MESVIGSIAFIIAVVNSIILWFFYKRMGLISHNMNKSLSEINIQSEITDIFSAKDGGHDVHHVANKLFRRVKNQFKLDVKSYSEIVNKLKDRLDIEEKLRYALIDFFDTMILISYRDESLSDFERVDIKRKLKLVLKMLPSEK